MKNVFYRKAILLLLPAMLFAGIPACEPFVDRFGDEEEAVYVTKNQAEPAPQPDSAVCIMTWNIRYGMARGAWFGDACGDKVVYSEQEILGNMTSVVKRINEVKPDILMLQEVDINSLRSGYVNELNYILDHTYFGYAVYGFQWKAQFVPSDGIGRIYETNVIFSRWPFGKATRIQLQLRGDQDALTRFFYERNCMVKAKIEIPGIEDFYVVNIHAAAFATDDTKHQHIIAFKQELDNIADAGGWFVAGGDLNTLPPGSDTTDYCMDDICPGESFHHVTDNPQHKEGSNYTPESDWLTGLYTQYACAVKLADYQHNQPAYFSHTTRPGHTWDRTLDYLFTNSSWQKESTVTHQAFLTDSDHAPVSSKLILKKK